MKVANSGAPVNGAKALDEKLDRLAELMIGHHGGDGRRRKT